MDLNKGDTMIKSALYKFLSECPLVEEIDLLDDQITFHVVIPDNADEGTIYRACAKVDLILMGLGIEESQIQYNDCEGYFNEGAIFFEEEN